MNFDLQAIGLALLGLASSILLVYRSLSGRRTRPSSSPSQPDSRPIIIAAAEINRAAERDRADLERARTPADAAREARRRRDRGR